MSHTDKEKLTVGIGCFNGCNGCSRKNVYCINAADAAWGSTYNFCVICVMKAFRNEAKGCRNEAQRIEREAGLLNDYLLKTKGE